MTRGLAAARDPTNTPSSTPCAPLKTARPSPRAATSGISLFIDPFGRTYEATDLFTPAIAVATVPVGQPATFYTRHGDFFAWGCLMISLVALVARFRKPRATREPAEADLDSEVQHESEADLDPEANHDPDPPRENNMPFLDHLEELRWRILQALGALVVGAAICFALSDSIVQILTRPYEEAVFSLENQQSSGRGAVGAPVVGPVRCCAGAGRANRRPASGASSASPPDP